MGRRLSVGIIGYRNHAERLIRLLNSHPLVNLEFVYHPTKDLFSIKFTNNLDDLLESDAVFISSPTSTHYQYLHYFIDNYICKSIGKMLAYLKNKFLTAKLNTNGSLLTEERAHEILDSGIQALVLSVDSTDESAYGKLRVGGA